MFKRLIIILLILLSPTIGLGEQPIFGMEKIVNEELNEIIPNAVLDVIFNMPNEVLEGKTVNFNGNVSSGGLPLNGSEIELVASHGSFGVEGLIIDLVSDENGTFFGTWTAPILNKFNTTFSIDINVYNGSSEYFSDFDVLVYLSDGLIFNAIIELTNTEFVQDEIFSVTIFVRDTIGVPLANVQVTITTSFGNWKGESLPTVYLNTDSSGRSRADLDFSNDTFLLQYYVFNVNATIEQTRFVTTELSTQLTVTKAKPLGHFEVISQIDNILAEESQDFTVQLFLEGVTLKNQTFVIFANIGNLSGQSNILIAKSDDVDGTYEFSWSINPAKLNKTTQVVIILSLDDLRYNLPIETIYFNVSPKENITQKGDSPIPEELGEVSENTEIVAIFIAVLSGVGGVGGSIVYFKRRGASQQ